MRLTCPNCGAQYEVDPEVIPASGRDVQCSNCGHTWYQKSQQSALDISQEPTRKEAGAAEKPEPKQEAARARGADARPAESEDAPQPRRVDPKVADILREEAEQEREKRAADATASAPSIETQTDLGLEDNPAETPPNIHERMARLRGMDDELGATAAASSATGANSRKELLPDIEEINSTLSPGEDADDILPPRDAERAYRGGFRRGFALVIILFGIMLLVYIYAPQIVGINPQTEPALSAYVDWVNGMRVGLDAFMSDAAQRLTRLLSSINGNE